MSGLLPSEKLLPSVVGAAGHKTSNSAMQGAVHTVDGDGTRQGWAGMVGPEQQVLQLTHVVVMLANVAGSSLSLFFFPKLMSAT